MRLGHLINLWGSVLVIVATNWWTRECWGSSWIVASTPGMAAAAPNLPSCPSYCLQGYLGVPVKANLMAGLWWCTGLGVHFLNEKWNVDASSYALFLENEDSSRFCLDIANASTLIGDIPALPAASARSLVISNCNSSSPTQRWTFDNAGHLKSLAGSSSSYAHPYLTDQHPDVYFLYLTEDTSSAQSFVIVNTSTIASYYTPALPAPNNQSNLILNGNLKMLTSFAPLALPSLKDITTHDWIWDGYYFVVCHWEVHGNLNVGGCSSTRCKLPQEWCSGSNADELLVFLSTLTEDVNLLENVKSGWIMQTVPTYPGSNYLLLFETRNPSDQIQKLLLSLSQVLTSSANGTANMEFEILPNQSKSQMHQFQFIANGNFVNVSFISKDTSECGPLINNIQLYSWPPGAAEQNEQNVVLPNQVGSASRLILAVTIVGWVLAVTECSGAVFYITSNLWRRRRNLLIGSSASNEASSHVQIIVFSYEQLKAYTENFSIQVGEGGFGKVYFGRLPESNQAIAVKRQNNADDTSFFQAEVALLSRVHHRYVVRFLGYCEDKGERMLVFEYMPNKSLHSRLHARETMAAPLSWEERLRIAYQVAYALEYLHNGANPPVLHRDVKSANVLLSETLVAKLADLGISKVGRPNELLANIGSTSTMTVVKGSLGYMDPYYLQTSMLSHKSDVYSFGVLLLEMVAGQKVIKSNTELLTTWAKRVYWGGDSCGDQETILDSRLQGSAPDDSVKAVLEIARSCLYEEPRHRPSIAEVARSLREQLAHLPIDEFSMGTDDSSIFSGR